MNKYIKSPINYTGNKYKLLPDLIPSFPKDINTFIDIFGGSGCVILNANANEYIYNEYNKPIFDIFNGIVNTNTETILSKIKEIISKYELSKTNEEGFLKLREDFNNGMNDWITHYTLMCYSFNYQSRFNSKGKYNSSFGRNRSQFSSVQESNIKELKSIGKDIKCKSFSYSDFDYDSLNENDFVYLDPPYLGSDAVYNEQNGWDLDKEQILYDIILKLNDNGVRFALSNNLKYDNPYLLNLCKQFEVKHIGSKYTNCSYHKKDRSEDNEILITNYV